MANFNSSNQSNSSLSAFDTIMEAFKAYYQCQPNYLPKNEKDGSYWSNTWSSFLEVEGFETFLPYLVQSGLLYERMWNIFQSNPHKTFSEIDKMAGEQMDWLDSLLYGPEWRGTKYKYLENTGASLSEVIESLQCFRDYQPNEVSSFTKEYWLQYPCFQEEQVDKLFQYLGINPEQPTQPEVKPMSNQPKTIQPEVKPTMSNQPKTILPVVDLLNDDENLTQWRSQIEQGMDPVCYEALQWLRDERELPEFYSMYGTKFQRSLAYYALIPLWESWFSKAITEGNVFAYETSDNPAFGFANALGIDVITPEGIDLESDELDPGLKGKYLVVKPPYSGKNRKTLAALVQGGMRLVTLADLHAGAIAHADITEKDVIRFLLNMGAKRDTTTGEYNLSPRKYVSFKIKFLNDEGVWSYREDDGRVLKTRLFYGVNGLAPKSSHAVFLMALSYLVQGSNYQQIKGRRAFLGNLFQDEVTVGWSHPILDQFIPRKLGTLQVGINHATWLLDVAKDADFMSVLEAYDAKGYSSFVHKGGKYAVIEAECTGFSVLPKNIDSLVQQYADDEEGLRAAVMAAKETLSPSDMETFIGWLADKLPKYTGRALWLVPSAAMIPAVGEKPLEYEDVADFINSF